MSEQNKILDVTYGKFSCRLEGFDDAVETMKAVVTYFHDLAGHDSFLEVAPGLPDMETLARLAQAQSGGQVTAEPLDGGVSLTRTEQLADDVSEDGAETEAEDDVSANEAEVEAEAPADEGMINAFVEAEEDAAVDDGLADEADEVAANDFASNETDEDNNETATDVHSEPEEEAIEETAEEAPADDDSFESRLNRIRAAVSQGNEVEATADSESADEVKAEEETAAKTSATVSDFRPGNPLAQRLARLAQRKSEVMMAEDRKITPLSQDKDDTGFDVAAEEDGADHLQSEDAAASDDVAPQSEPVEEHEFDADIELAEEEELAEDATADDAWAAADEADVETSYDESSSDDIDVGETTSEDTGFDAQDEEAVEDDLDDEADTDKADTDDRPTSQIDRPLLLTTPQRPMADDASINDDDDFDLSAELAEIEKEIAARPRNEMTRHGLPRRVEDAMSRIFTETNQQLDSPEGRRHRDALAQLKAAVAATEAAKQLGESNRSRDAGETFRDDLGALDAENRQKRDGLPPLKLVTTVEGTADGEASKPRETSKPLDIAAQRLREIAATKDSDEDTPAPGGFAAFLEKQGVSDLGDKLEAAAAYLAFVENDPDFTRPQLMRLVQSASREEISREDGLRSFGRLLRMGRFAKMNNGRFKVDDNTPFRPRKSRLA
ncbi:hypothetical protein [Yoonia litorea]|uniref:Uncharacterized protein n=1 Tax=Yoonia litorea TaxID=1123755 RepID=A0A1I6MGV3_9RHOB|nr:hypothetical protein [Yoonia litorea]SFS14861.1 hypothetical protein SAMN05444714_1766 [Yoonia litorea]